MRGHGWQVFGIIVVLGIVQVVVGILLAVVAVAISDGRVADALGTYVGSVLVAPLSALAATVVYLRLRKIKGQGDVREGVAREATYGGGFAPPQSDDPRTPSGETAPTSVGPPAGAAATTPAPATPSEPPAASRPRPPRRRPSARTRRRPGLDVPGADDGPQTPLRALAHRRPGLSRLPGARRRARCVAPVPAG